MGKKCSLKNCKNYQKEPSYGSDISFHGLPKKREARKNWLKAIPNNLIRDSTSYIYICSAHFTQDSFQPAAMGLKKNMLRRTAVPSIFGNLTSTPNVDANVKTTDNMVNLVNTTGQTVFVITKTEPPSVINSDTHDVGIQVCLPTDKEKELHRKMYILQKRLARKEERISLIMTDFKTLMDQN